MDTESLNDLDHLYQLLKGETNKACIRILEPVVESFASSEYLRKALNTSNFQYFNVVESPLKASNLQVIFHMRGRLEHGWDEHTDWSMIYANSTQGVPQSSHRTGGFNFVSPSQQGPSVPGSPISATTAGNSQPECTRNRLNKLGRLGLQKLTCETEMVSKKTPETLKFNLSKLRNAQAQLQILNFTSMRVFEVLDCVKDDSERYQSECIRSEDPVSEKLFDAVHLTARGVVFGGSGLHGENWLRL